MLDVLFCDFQKVPFNLNYHIFIDYVIRQTTKPTGQGVKHGNKCNLSQLHLALGWLIVPLRRSSSVSFLVATPVVYHNLLTTRNSTVLFLNERDALNLNVLNKWHQQDCTCDACMYNFASGVNFYRENFCGYFFFCGSWKTPQKSQKLESEKISSHAVCPKV